MLLFIVAALCVSLVVSLLIGDHLAARGRCRVDSDAPLTAEHHGCAVLEVRTDGKYPVVALLPQRSIEATGKVRTGTELKLVHVSLQGDITGGVAAVLRAAVETDHRVDVTVTSSSDDNARRVVRVVDVAVSGGGAHVQFTNSEPYAPAER